jgi:cytochrome P450
MKEILRITFPVGSRLPMICREDMVYGDWTIPAGVRKFKSRKLPL